GDADEHDRGGEAIGPLRRSPSREVAAVRAAGDADLRLVDETLLDQGIDAVEDVGELAVREIALAELRECDSAPRARPVVGIEHVVALARRDLPRGAVARQPAVHV